MELKYANGYENSTPEKQRQAMINLIEEESEMYLSLTGNYCDNLKKLMKWRKLNYKKLAEDTGMNPETISRCVKGETTNLNTLLLICLALHLPLKFSNKILQDSGYTLSMNKKEHQFYEFVLETMHSKTISEIQTFLSTHGIATL